MDAWQSFKRRREMRKVRGAGQACAGSGPTEQQAVGPSELWVHQNADHTSVLCGVQMKRASGVKSGVAGRRATGITLHYACMECSAEILRLSGGTMLVLLLLGMLSLPACRTYA